MKRKYSILFFVFLVSFSFLFFSNDVLSVENENDINFNWRETTLYEEVNLGTFNVNNLNYTYYNDNDYYQHANGFDSFQYDNYDYLENGTYLDDVSSLIRFNESIYVFPQHTYDDIRLCNDDLTVIQNIEHNLTEQFDTIKDITSHNNDIYMLGQVNYGTYLSYKLIRLNHQFIVEEVIFERITTGWYYLMNLAFYDDYIYIASYEQPFPNDGYVLQYTTNGTLIDTIDITATTTRCTIIYYYESLFYVYDFVGFDIDLYDTDFNYIDTILYDDNLWSYLIDDDIVYCVDTESVEIFPLNILFEEQVYYDISDNFPSNEGLYNSIDYIDMNYTQQTNQQGIYFGNYTASYSFEDDADDATPEGFYFTEPYGSGTGYAEVKPIIYGHKKVVDVYDGSATDWANLNKFITGNNSGTIEYWLLIDSNTDYSGLFLYNAITVLFQITFESDGLVYSNGATSLMEYDANEWYHIRIDFESTLGGYMGLSQYTYDCYIDNVSVCEDVAFMNNVSPTLFRYRTGYANLNYHCYLDAIGFTWESYVIGTNMLNGCFYNEWNLYNETHHSILSIECNNGYYSVNDVDINYNIFDNNSLYINDTWSLRILTDQVLENGTIYFFNETLDVIHTVLFNSSALGNIKYIKHTQHYYKNSYHYVNISNFNIIHQDTMIAGQNGYISYFLDIEDTSTWNFDNTQLEIIGIGLYKFYVSNGSYGNVSAPMYSITTNWIELNNEEIIIDVSFLTYEFENPYLIVETINGLYPLISIQIIINTGIPVLYDDRGNLYNGVLTSLNVNITTSFFYVDEDENKMYFQITFDDDDLEYLKLSFNIINIVNLNYRILYNTYLNISSVYLIAQMNLINTDGTSVNINIQQYYDSGTEYIHQNKNTDKINFYLSDNDLLNNENNTIGGYIEGFTYNYSETVSLSIFADRMILMLIPLLVILSLTFGITYAVKDDSTREPFNRKLFFPIFIIVSFLTFIIGFFDSWILFIIIIATIVYFIDKRG